MESKANIERIFDKLLAEALTSPLPKLTYRGPIKKSRLVLGCSTHASKTTNSSSETSTSNVAAASKPHALVVSPASEPQALTVAAAASKPPALKVSTVSKSQALKVSGGVLKRIPTANTSVASSASFKPPAPSKASSKKVPSSPETIAYPTNLSDSSLATLTSKTQDSHVRENQVSKLNSFNRSAKDASTAETNDHVSKSIHQCTGTTIINTQDVQTNENHQLFKLASSLSRTKKTTLLSHSKVVNERTSAVETCDIGSAATGTFDGGLSSADDNSKKRALRSKNKKPTLHSHGRLLDGQEEKQQPSDADVSNSTVDGNSKKRALSSRNKLSTSRSLRNDEQSEQASVDCGNGSSRSNADAEAGQSSKDNDTLVVSGVEPRGDKAATVGDAVDSSPSEINNIPICGEDPVEGGETISRTDGKMSRSADDDSLSKPKKPTLHSRRKGFDGKDVNQRPLPYDENGDDKEEENGDDDAEEEEDLPCSGHVSRPHHDGDGEEEDDRDEISSVIDDEEEFFMHKPRPERKGAYTMKKKNLNLDALWSRIILKSTVEERKRCSKKQKRFLHRNLQHGRYFFKVYFSRMKHIQPDNQHNSTPDKLDGQVIHDASVEGTEENNATRKRRGVKRKSMTQAVNEGVASKSNKKTRSRSQGNSNKAGGNDKASQVKGRRLNGGTRGTSKKTKGTNKASKSAQLKNKTKQNAVKKNVGRRRSGSKNVANKKGGTARSGSKNVANKKGGTARSGSNNAANKKGGTVRSGSKNAANKKGGMVRGGSKNAVKKNVGRPRSRSQKAVNTKSAIVRSSNRTLSMPAASKSSSARMSRGLCLNDDVTMVTREEEENDDDIVFFDAGDDDDVNEALKSGSSKVTRKTSKGSSHFKSRVTSLGDGNKKQCDSNKNGAKKMPQGRRSHSKTKWTISDLNPCQDGVAAGVMPLSSLARASSVGSLGVEPESTDLDEPSSISENWLTDVRPLFSSFGSRHHCGSVWKSIIDDA